MQIQYSLFPLLNEDVDNKIFSFIVNTNDLRSLANISVEFSTSQVEKIKIIFDELSQTLSQKDLRNHVKANPASLFLGYYATHLLFTIGRQTIETLEMFASFHGDFFQNYQPLIEVAQKKIDVGLDITEICKNKIGIRYLDIEDYYYFIERMLKNNYVKAAIDFCQNFKSSNLYEITALNDIIKKAIFLHKDWNNFGYMISQIVSEKDKISESLLLLKECTQEHQLEKGLEILKKYELDLKNLKEIDQKSLLRIYLQSKDFSKAWELIGDLSDYSKLTENQISLIMILQQRSLELSYDVETSKAKKILYHYDFPK